VVRSDSDGFQSAIGDAPRDSRPRDTKRTSDLSGREQYGCGADGHKFARGNSFVDIRHHLVSPDWRFRQSVDKWWSNMQDIFGHRFHPSPIEQLMINICSDYQAWQPEYHVVAPD